MRDPTFTYSLETLKRYVDGAALNAVAVTNHDVFDLEQFRTISAAIPTTLVFPGIEVSLDDCHVLVIANVADAEEFADKCQKITSKIKTASDSLPARELGQSFGDLGQYLVIPHYTKHPAVSAETLAYLGSHMAAGEVESPKKFIQLIKDPSKPTPVLFSDARMSTRLERLPTRKTFIDCGDLTFASLRACLRDKAKVALTEKDGNALWQALEDGQNLSTGLNVIVGQRSSGKTYTLDRIAEATDNVKYIPQFSLVQDVDDAYKRDVEKRRSASVEGFLAPFKDVVAQVLDINTSADDRSVDEYVGSLLKSALETELKDVYSKAALFNESALAISRTDTLLTLIDAVQHIIENIEYRATVEKHVAFASLKAMFKELVETLWAKTLENAKRQWVNDVVRETKRKLQLLTSATAVKEIDLYEVLMARKCVARIEEIVRGLRKEGVIASEPLQGFRIETTKAPFHGAGELKALSGKKVSFASAYALYENPYEYLRALSELELPQTELYKYFAKVSYRILNRDGAEVSGGERSEFRLLQEIADAQNYDILLIDEPESSFDNLFLAGEVNKLLGCATFFL